jgi:hypothetical protein
MRYQAFVGGSNPSQSSTADSQRTINFYIERTEAQGAKAQAVLYPTPGYSLFSSITDGPVRGLFSEDGRTFGVVGFKLYEFDQNGVATDRGDVLRDDNPATFASNGDAGHQLFITSGNTGYIFDLLSNTLTTVLAGATIGGYCDGYFVALDTATSTLKASSLVNGISWPGLQVAQRQTASDRWIGMAVIHREVWLFGSQSSEVWVNIGQGQMPFAPISSALMQQGTAAPFSVAQLDQSLFWLGENQQGTRTVFRSNGYHPERVSTHALEWTMAQYGVVKDAIAFTIQWQGHTFYVLSFRNEGATWVFDAATGLWTEWLFWNEDDGVYEAHRAICHCHGFNRYLIGDRDNGNLYALGPLAFTDNGATIRRVRRAPHIANELNYIRYDELRLDLEVGVGLVDPIQGHTPQIMMRYSNDGGKTWQAERLGGTGKLGKYKQPVRWARLGTSRDRVFEISTTDPIPWRIVDAYLTIGGQG